MRPLNKPFVRYYEDMRADLNRYEEDYTLHPKKAALRMIIWNILYLFIRLKKKDMKDAVWSANNGFTGRKYKILFPYESVTKDADIIIYGVNDIGRTLAKQMNVTRYCNILCFVDQGVQQPYDRHEQIEGYPVCTVRKLKSFRDFDFIVVAEHSEERKREILQRLDAYHVPLEKVIFDVKTYKIVQKTIFSKNARIYIIVTGGLGDYIIEKRFITEFQKLDKNMELYITSDNLRKKDFLSAVFFDLPNTTITYENESDIALSSYDMVFRMDHVITLLFVNKTQLKIKSRNLLNFAKVWIRKYDHIKELNKKIQWESVVHVERARVLGANRYSIMGTYTNLTIADTIVPIAMKRSYRKNYEALQLKGTYITLNRGADERPDGKTQVKVWPSSAYCELIQLVKKGFPNLKIVQIGNQGSEKFPDADHYVFGQHIETIKYVLRHSRVHIDCEGGLVHLATQLGTKCIVLFGPTPEFYYGYKENINIVAPECHDCMGTTEEWYTECYRGDVYPPGCMRSIAPQMVYDALCKELGETAFGQEENRSRQRQEQNGKNKK